MAITKTGRAAGGGRWQSGQAVTNPGKHRVFDQTVSWDGAMTKSAKESPPRSVQSSKKPSTTTRRRGNFREGVQPARDFGDDSRQAESQPPEDFSGAKKVSKAVINRASVLQTNAQRAKRPNRAGRNRGPSKSSALSTNRRRRRWRTDSTRRPNGNDRRV